MEYTMRLPWWAFMSGEKPGPVGRGGRGRRPWQGGPMGPGLMAPGPFGPGGPGGPWEHHPGRRGRARRGDVRQAILALLAEAPLNGYQIIQTLAERTGGVWKPSPGAVYPALAQLEDEQLVEQFDNEGQRAYRLTEAGRGAAEAADKPWETVNQENAPRHPEAAGELWQEFTELAMAARTVARSGSTGQVRKAVAVLAETRRRLFGVLAEPDEPAEDAG